MSISLAACGGEYRIEPQLADWEIDVELCEAQDGKSELFHVTSLDTGDTQIEARCSFPKDKEVRFCKPDNGRGYEC